MALKVWLPLNGNLENKGVDGIEMAGAPASWNTSGKIGKCAAFTGSTSNVIYNNTTDYNYTDNFSWTIWIKTNFTGTATQFIFTNGRADAGGRGYGLRCSSTTVCNCYFGSSIIPVSVTGGEWTHLAFTKSGTNIKIYKNGTLEKEETFSGTLPTYSDGNGLGLGCFHYSSNIYPYYGSINDFRIYDHCLSKLEVKEIAQGLVLHYKLDGFSGGAGENLLQGSASVGSSSVPGWVTNGSATNITVIDGNTIHYQYNLNNTKYIPSIVSNVVAPLEWGKTYVYSMDLKFSEEISLSTSIPQHWWLGARNADNIWQVAINSHSIANGTTKVEYLKNHSGTLPANTWVNITTRFTIRSDAPESGYNYPALRPFVYGQVLTAAYTGVVKVWMKNCKIEEGSIATPWSLSSSELGKDLTKIIDSSGYGNDGTVVGNILTSNNKTNGKYNTSTYFASGNTDYIITPTLTLPGDAITMNFWFKSSNKTPGADYHMPLAAAANSNQAYEMSIHKNGYLRGGLVVAGTRRVDNCTSTKLTDGNWHMCTMTYDGAIIKRYVDAVMEKSTTVTGSLATSTLFVLGHYGTNTSYYSKEAYESDVRIYTTALSADDVLTLYKASAQIDKSKAFHTFAISEGSDKTVRKNGVTEIQNISEFDALSYLKYDPNLHIEPDGSVWVHIYHHNHPDLGSFASTDTFAASVKKDENRWFNGTQVCNQLNKWEFLVKYAFTQNGTEYKERWIQTKNPESAVFGDVDAADITRITGDGYKTGTWGGLYKKNSSAYWVMNNGNSGNWFGATGSFSIYQGGIPGYGGGTVTTTGYNDLYVRIDNVLSTVSTNGRLTKNGVLIGSNFIEK